MARAPTTFSRVSTGYKDSKNTIAESGYDLSCIDFYVAGTTTHAGATTGTTAAFTSTLSANGAATFQSTVSSRGVGTFSGGVYTPSIATFNSNVTIGGGLTVRSNATFQTSNVSIGGGLTVDSGLTSRTGIAVGTGGRLTEISTATAGITLGAIAPLESSSLVTVALSGATRGDTIIVTLDSLYARVAANTDVSVFASSGSTTGEVSVWGVNSTLTSVTPTAGTVIRLTRIAHPTYL